MANQGRVVTLSGTWTRKNTSSGDINTIRRETYAMNRRADMVDDSLPRVTFTAKNAGWKDSERYSRKTREGTFVVTFFIVCRMSLTERQCVARAKTMLKWLAQDITCVPPKMTVTTVEVGRYRW